MPGPVFLLMPQWQGSSSSRAMRIVDGANALRGDLPASALHEVAVPLEAGDSLGTPALRLSSLLQARASASEVLRSLVSPAITLGGDSASSLPGLEHAMARHGAERVAVLWCDAHADFQHPSTSPSGAVSPMALRTAMGDGVSELHFAAPLPASLVALLGTRQVDEDEQHELDVRGISPVDHVEPELPSRLGERLRSMGATHLYVHIGLDVLDPSEITGVHSPVPFGLTLAQLTAAISEAVSVLPLAGAAICEFAPASEEEAADDIPTVLRLLSALTSGTAKHGRAA
ncbi:MULTISPECIES: arginase family protein [unclassified Leucobacter]|uniref:arginase family protein n=1 Tax=unclassified Leucobacter TaxID=2621730 RepID=UPI00165EB5E6|nr:MULTISPECIES: arginase family protein [unclassified Leucobacter]MBC9926535.1 arginase family protein [Leucobacter sp. cx-169]MBC9937136.1 arginase family protein [Leucobacter sp. cx-87]